MNNQLVTDENLVLQVALTILAIALAVLLVLLGVHRFQHSDPYVRNVLSLNGDPVLGHAIFQMNCAGCHGIEAEGRVGPSLRDVSARKSRVSLIHQVISGQTPPMPQFQPAPQEMADLLSYLESL
ncbi:cytochrome c [Leptolyngbya sp. FACHB-36]|uniref:c-type cytochrome n=1 Tax=Leptolyngbya sp. FACHB-36 TaxID=2692808 RepID=UPI0016800FDF|nr:cytochrome c [Leptolyngbya sp. FACHB-36]MBD2019610.1 cytochrome c [Leptolyngbya sp. FACHB-36]